MPTAQCFQSKITLFSQNQDLLITDVLVSGHNTQYFELEGKTKQKTCSTIRVPVLEFRLYQVSLRKSKIYISAWTNEPTKVTDLCVSSLISCVPTKGTQCLWMLPPTWNSILHSLTAYSLFILFVSFLPWLFLLVPYSSVIP